MKEFQEKEVEYLAKQYEDSTACLKDKDSKVFTPGCCIKTLEPDFLAMPLD